MRSRARAAILLALWAMIPGPSAEAAVCAVTTPIGSGGEEVRGLAVQSDGKIVAVGYSLAGANDDFAVVRYNPDLTLDTSFQGTGKVVTPIGTSNDRAEAVAIQPDGKIVVVGYALMGGNNDLALARYNSNGSLDLSFDGDGKMTLSLGASNDELFDVAIQTDGKIVVVGRTRNSNYDFLVARFDSNGALDPGFASGGIQTFSLGSFDEAVNAVTLQSDGKIVMAGTEFDPADNDVVVARFNTNGSFDPSFAGVGYLTNSPLQNDHANDVAIQSDGKIVVAGDSVVGADRDVAVMRLNANGTGDTSFNLTGFVRTDLGSANDLGEALQIQSDGKILVAGTGAGSDMYVLRYDSAGTPDPSFDGDGKASVGLVGTTAAYAVALGSGGSIYVAGSTIGGSLTLDFAVGRFNSDGSSPCTEIYLHPTATGSSVFTTFAGCTAGTEWRCVNDQAGEAPTGFPASNDGAATHVRDNATGRAMFRLVDSAIPPGAIVNRVEIFSQTGIPSGTGQAFKLSYQRMGFDATPIDGFTVGTTQTCCFDATSWIVSGIAWTLPQLDALEIGALHTAGGPIQMSQVYAKVTYMLAPPSVNYRSIGTAPDYTTGTVSAILNSPVVTGLGTSWLSSNRGRGDRIQIDLVDYTILEVDSETQLTLTSPFVGASGAGKPHTISRQYNNPLIWEDCIDGNPCTFFPVSSANLVSDNRQEVGVVYDDGTPYNQQLVIDGSVTDAVHDITLTVNPADRHFGRANVGAVFDRLTSPGPVVTILDDFVTIEWLEIRNGTSQGIDIGVLGPVNHIILRNNLVHDVPSAGIRNTSIPVLDVYNNIVYDTNNGIELGTSSGAQVYNNTVYNGGGYGIGGGSSSKARNNISHTFTGQDFSFGSVHLSSSHNLSSDTTATSASPGGGDRPNVLLTGIDFVSTTPGSEDLHILTTSAAKDVGATLALFSNDIDDGPRPVLWDIGADEFGTGGGSSVNTFSIGTNPGTLASGSASVPVAGSTTVTFGASLPSNVGIGDQLTIDPGGPNDETLYILSRTSATEVEVQSPATFAHPSHFFQIRRAFNSIQDWENARQGNLVGDGRSEVGVAYNDGTFPNGVLIDGSVTDSSHFMTLTVAPGQRHLGIAGTGARVDGSNTSVGEITVSDPYTVVEWLEVTRVRGATAAGVRVLAPDVLLANLLSYDNRNGAAIAGGGGSGLTIRNSIVYRNDLDGISGNISTDSLKVYNCTVYGNSQQGIDAVGSIVVDVRNTSSMANVFGDFAVGGGSQLNNMSADGTAVGFTFMIPAGEFVSTTPGAEDLHLKGGAVAIDNGIDLSSLFPNDVDDDPRPLGASWDIGADEFGGGGPAPTISSFNNQTFTVGGPLLPAATITITDNPVTPTIIAANDLRIRIPLGFPMRFDSAQTMLFISGPASFKVASQVKAYEDSDRTVVLDVVMDFGVNDWITVDFLRFWSYTAPAPADNLELEVGNDGVVSATDDKTITIFPDAVANLSSDDHQVFTQFQPPAPALPFTVSEGTGTSIVPSNDIRIRIPAGFNMTWDTGGSISFGGPAAGKVTLPVSYEDSFRTLVIPVTTGFVPGDYVTVSGARFQGFFGVSPVMNLTLDVGASTDFDDKTIEITAASDVLFFTATAKDQAVKLEWFQPASGLCDNVLLLRRDDGIEPTGPFDGSALQVDFRPCTLGVKDTVDDPFPLGNGTLYAYAAFVEYSGGTYTDGEFVKARPMDSVGTPVQWAYSTGATAMAPPGLRFAGGASYVYAVSNDSILHSMNGGSTGGDWPAGWKPYELGGPAQARPPVVSFPVGSATSGAAFLGSQDGNVYAVNALDGSEEWKQPISSGVQAAPAGHFSAFFPGAFDIVITGTRDPNGPNELVALDVDTGAPVWSFDNSPAQLGDGKEIGIISGSASIDYLMKWAFFASHTRGGLMGSNRTLWCVDFSSGTPFLRWSLALGDIEGSPVPWNNALYVGTVSGILYAVDRYAAAGTVNWSRSIGDGQIKAFAFPQIGSNRVLVSTTSKVTSTEDFGPAYNPAWQLTSTDIPGPSTPIFVPGTGKVLVGSSDGHLYQFDAFSPLPTTRVQLGDGSSAVGVPSVDIVNSMIYVGTDEGVIYGVTFPLP